MGSSVSVEEESRSGDCVVSTDQQKQAVGAAAALEVSDGMTVGLGTGSTAVWFVNALAARNLNIACVATSTATADLAASLGLRLIDLDEASNGIDLTVDGADEIGPGLDLIKGGGAALLREKLVWEASRRCLAIADAAKKVDRLGRFPLPVEVVSFGHRRTADRLRQLTGSFGLPDGVLRVRDGEIVRTDGGNVIYDIPCGSIAEPHVLAKALKAVTGVVEHGLFIGLTHSALLGTDQGVLRLSL
jgi:ribose 5-phosphate isomerase A